MRQALPIDSISLMLREPHRTLGNQDSGRTVALSRSITVRSLTVLPYVVTEVERQAFEGVRALEDGHQVQRDQAAGPPPRRRFRPGRAERRMPGTEQKRDQATGH
jgi:hypothetical protein